MGFLFNTGPSLLFGCVLVVLDVGAHILYAFLLLLNLLVELSLQLAVSLQLELMFLVLLHPTIESQVVKSTLLVLELADLAVELQESERVLKVIANSTWHFARDRHRLELPLTDYTLVFCRKFVKTGVAKDVLASSHVEDHRWLKVAPSKALVAMDSKHNKEVLFLSKVC